MTLLSSNHCSDWRVTCNILPLIRLFNWSADMYELFPKQKTVENESIEIDTTCSFWRTLTLLFCFSFFVTLNAYLYIALLHLKGKRLDLYYVVWVFTVVHIHLSRKWEYEFLNEYFERKVDSLDRLCPWSNPGLVLREFWYVCFSVLLQQCLAFELKLTETVGIWLQQTRF